MSRKNLTPAFALAAAAGLCVFASAALIEVPLKPPPIYSRAQWSKEALPKLPIDLPKTRIILHHTAYPVRPEDLKLTGIASWRAAVAHAREAQFLHQHIRGWRDIGYHYMIDWEGRILEGRPVNRLGAHVEKHNTGSIGIVLMGNLSEQRPTAKQIATLRALLKWLMAEYDIPGKNVEGHYAKKFTTCPGTYLSNLWDPNAQMIDYVQLGKRQPRHRAQRPVK